MLLYERGTLWNLKEVTAAFHSYEKFYLESNVELTIGKDAGSDITCDYQKMVSEIHTWLMKQRETCRVINKSPNGTYVNSMKVQDEMPLSLGDYINIMGLHIVYLGQVLAVDTEGISASVNNAKLRLMSD